MWLIACNTVLKFSIKSKLFENKEECLEYAFNYIDCAWKDQCDYFNKCRKAMNEPELNIDEMNRLKQNMKDKINKNIELQSLGVESEKIGVHIDRNTIMSVQEIECQYSHYVLK